MKLIQPKISIYIVLLAITILAMFALRHCANYKMTPENANDSINVAIEYSPLSLYMYSDTLGGFEYDLMRTIATKGKMKIKFHPIVSLEKAIEGLDNNKYDILIAQFPVTADAKEKYIFSDAIYLDKQILVQRKDSLGNLKIKSQLDLAQDTIYAVKGSPMVVRIEALSHEIGDTIYIKQENEYNAEQLLIMVSKGLIDYAVINERVARNLAKDYNNINVGTNISFSQFQSWAFAKDKIALRDSIDSLIKQVKLTEGYKALFNRYF